MFKNEIKALLLFKIDENIKVVKLGTCIMFTRLDSALLQLLTLPCVHHIMVFIIAIYKSHSCDSFACI